MAGLHFNSALSRLASVYHREMKIVLDKKPSKKFRVGILLPQVLKRHSDWKHSHIKKIDTEVDHLKHNSLGLSRRNVKFADALKATDELLTLFEKWADESKL